MKNHSALVHFDWAVKRLLRNKSNFVVLEGFLSTLLGQEIRIVKMLESESNKDSVDDKFNRVDMLAEDSFSCISLGKKRFFLASVKKPVRSLDKTAGNLL